MSIGLIVFLVILVVVIIIIAILVIFFFLHRNKNEPSTKKKKPSLLVFDKGQRMENYVSRVLINLNIEDSYQVEDLIIPTKNGGSSEIDNILVTHKGIYVFECKNWSGTIVGNEEDKDIYQIDVSGEYRHIKKNPLKQNASHIYALKNLLKRSDEYFIPVVVFNTDNLQFAPNNPSVITLTYLKRFILEQETNRDNILSISEISSIKAILQDHKTHPKVSEKEHLDNIKSSHPNSSY